MTAYRDPRSLDEAMGEIRESRKKIKELYSVIKAPQPVADTDCARSHPHENMSQMCELRTEIARLKFCARQTAPDLTDAEIFVIGSRFKTTYLGMPCGDVLEFARAVLAAQKGK